MNHFNVSYNLTGSASKKRVVISVPAWAGLEDCREALLKVADKHGIDPATLIIEHATPLQVEHDSNAPY